MLYVLSKCLSSSLSVSRRFSGSRKILVRSALPKMYAVVSLFASLLVHSVFPSCLRLESVFFRYVRGENGCGVPAPRQGLRSMFEESGIPHAWKMVSCFFVCCCICCLVVRNKS